MSGKDVHLPYAADTAKQYRFPDIRAFNKAVLRAYSGMRQSQNKYTWVWLPKEQFPTSWVAGMGVVLEHAQDNARARLLCEDRHIYVKPVKPHICGVCPDTHGGLFLSRALVYSFLVGG